MIVSFLVALALGLVLTPLASVGGRKLGILDLPDPRKLHGRPIPRTGGWAVFLGLTVAALVTDPSRELSGLLLGGGLIFAVGAADDVHSLPASLRLVAQVVAALVMIVFGDRLTFVPHVPGEVFWESILTILWMVVVTNAFNFLDGVDGLAGSMGVLCAGLFLVLLLPSGQSGAALFAAALAGTCLGFLPYNWRPARVFLGDGGSTTIGFFLAGLAVMGSWASDNPLLALSTPLLVLSIPLFDLIYITISRVKNGHVHNLHEWIEYVGRDHFHHRLLTLGLSVRQTVGFILLVNLTLGLAALTLREAPSPGDALLLLFQAFLIFSIIAVLMLIGRRSR